MVYCSLSNGHCRWWEKYAPNQGEICDEQQTNTYIYSSIEIAQVSLGLYIG